METLTELECAIREGSRVAIIAGGREICHGVVRRLSQRQSDQIWDGQSDCSDLAAEIGLQTDLHGRAWVVWHPCDVPRLTGQIWHDLPCRIVRVSP